MTQDASSQEKDSLTFESKEPTGALIVHQPTKISELLDTLNAIERISERLGEDKSGDMAASGGKRGGVPASGGISVRDEAIRNIPAENAIRKGLSRHIEKEIRVLRKEVHRTAKRAYKAGNAHLLNELYARIRRLSALLSSIMEASYDVVKRLFIRVFIDKQPIL